MRPFRARGSAVKTAGFAAPPQGRTFFPLDGGAGEPRQLQNPLSLFGCAEKRKRFLMVSREKTLAEAFQAPPEMPFPAFYGGYLDADLSAWITQPRMAVSEAGGGSGCPLLLFCCRTLAVTGDWWKGRSRMPSASVFLPRSGGYRKNGAMSSQTARVRQRKENGGSSGRDPEFRSGQEKTLEVKPTATTSPKPP